MTMKKAFIPKWNDFGFGEGEIAAQEPFPPSNDEGAEDNSGTH
jgi:hypothetical protein